MDNTLAAKVAEKRLTPVTDGFVFMSPHHSFATHGCFTRITCPAQAGAAISGELNRRLDNAFQQAKKQGVEKPIVVGAIPFDTRMDSALFIPESWQRCKLHNSFVARPERQPKITRCRRLPEQSDFMEMVEQAIKAIKRKDIDKVVLARLIDVTTEAPINIAVLWDKLITQNPASYNFHLPLADGSTLIGASPELLVRKQGNRFSSLPLAGSAGRNLTDNRHDQRVGEKLLNSTKDRHEHSLVVNAMKNVLQPRSHSLIVAHSPELLTTPTLWHLATHMEGEVKDARESALSLACLLHPTPALSGFPHQAAQQLIAELEPFERELFGGIVGWCDSEGNGEWVVTIRCARVMGKQVRLFAGAGIVSESLPESEWLETGVKLSTMLKVFGLN